MRCVTLMKKAKSRHKYILCKVKRKIKSILYPKKISVYEGKAVPADIGESLSLKRKNWKKLYRELMSYDVISFDLFDTLIFRCFSDPTDVFYLTGMKLSYPDFRRIRIEAEQRAREIAWREKHTFEVTLEDIWKETEKETGICAEEGIKAEIEAELQCCMANPYMKHIFDALQKHGKKILITSDMYLNRQQISKILTTCGYQILTDLFLSGENGVSKSDGRLFEQIRNTYGKDLRYVHIGDHYAADVKNPRTYGFASIYYKNVNTLGNPYRAMDLSPFTGSIYRGLVNAHIHCGWKTYSKDYEYGYIYGGLFVVGYCRFIHSFVMENKIEKLLFLSRDGYILHKAYKLLYSDDIPIEYVLWSRSAALKITAARFRHEYFKRFLTHKADQGYSIEKALADMELSPLTENLCRSVKICKKEKLTHRNSSFVKNYLIDHWTEVEACYEEEKESGRQYYSRVLEGVKKAAAVDIGWMGSGAFMLDYAVRKIWKLDCSITGILAGTNSSHTYESDAGETFLVQKSIVSYMYSQMENRDLWKFHDPSLLHNLYWELLLGAPEGSLKGFYLDDQRNCLPVLKEEPQNLDNIREIHRGILDFVCQFQQTENKLGFQIPISGRDAYSPMLLLQSPKNRQAMKAFHKLLDDPFVD